MGAYRMIAIDQWMGSSRLEELTTFCCICNKRLYCRSIHPRQAGSTQSGVVGLGRN